MGEIAARDVAASRGQTVIAGKVGDVTGAGRLDVASVGKTPDGRFTFSVYEAKGGDSPGLVPRTIADGTRAEQGSLAYLRDLLTPGVDGSRITQRLRELADQPGHDGLMNQLRGDGLELDYQFINARTNGAIHQSDFALTTNPAERVLLYLDDTGALQVRTSP